MWANDIWNREWCLSSTGAITRLFFPSLNSASVVGSLQLSPQMAQVITGHCSLNVHQHRFGFKDDPGCECGAAEETVEHFLFYCPKYERDDLIIVSLEVTGMWPPPLARIPEDKTLWLAMSRFVRKSKRISSVFWYLMISFLVSYVLCATRVLPLENFTIISISSLSFYCFNSYVLAPSISGIGDFVHSGPTSRSSWLYQRGACKSSSKGSTMLGRH